MCKLGRLASEACLSTKLSAESWEFVRLKDMDYDAIPLHVMSQALTQIQKDLKVAQQMCNF